MLGDSFCFLLFVSLFVSLFAFYFIYCFICFLIFSRFWTEPSLKSRRATTEELWLNREFDEQRHGEAEDVDDKPSPSLVVSRKSPPNTVVTRKQRKKRKGRVKGEERETERKRKREFLFVVVGFCLYWFSFLSLLGYI